MKEMTIRIPAAPSMINDDAPGRWRALVKLAAAMLLAMTTWFSATAVLPQMQADWGMSTNVSSFLAIAVQVGFVIGAVSFALLNIVDVVPPRRLMLVGALCAASANALLVFSHGPATALPFRFATGLFLAAVYPSGLKSVATWFRRSRGTALGIMVGALTLGSAAPHLVNGLGGVRWQIVILVTSMLTLAGGLAAEFIATDGPFPFPRPVLDFRQTGQAFKDRGLRLATIGYFGHMWELYAMWAWTGTFFRDTLHRHGWSEVHEAAAIITFAVIAIGALGCWVGGIMGDRWGRTRTTALAMTTSGTCAVAIGLSRDGPLILVLTMALLWGFSVVADSAQFSTMATELAHPSYVGTAVTVQLAVGFMLTVPTIWLVPILQDELSWRWAFAFLAAGPVLGVASMLQLLRSPDSQRIAAGRG